MLVLQIDSITGATLPYIIYVCDVYGNQCAVLSYINAPIPPSITLNIPSQFNNVPAIGIKVIDANGCEVFETIYCFGSIPTPTPTLTQTLTPTPTPTQTNTPTLTPTPTPTQTLTNTPTLTPTPTTSGCNHLYYLPFGFRTNVTGDFSTSFLSACTAFNCVTGGTCAVNAANLVYLDQSEPQIGSNIYFNIDDCFAGPLNGYFLVKIGGSPSYNAIAEVIAGVVTDLPSC